MRPNCLCLLQLVFPDVLKDVCLHMCPHLPRGFQVPAGELLKVILHQGTLINISYQLPDFNLQSGVGQVIVLCCESGESPKRRCYRQLSWQAVIIVWDALLNFYIFLCPEQEDEPWICHNVSDAGCCFGCGHRLATDYPNLSCETLFCLYKKYSSLNKTPHAKYH